MSKIDMRKVELARVRHDEADDAYEEWESQHLPAEWWDYPNDYPVSSRASMTVGKYAKQYRRSQQVTLGSRTVVDE